MPQQFASVPLYFQQLSTQLKLLCQKEYGTSIRTQFFFTFLDLSSLLVTIAGIIDEITQKFYENNCCQFQNKTNLSLEVI